MEKNIVEGKEPSLLPDGEWKLIWNDEFDQGSLDQTKWEFRTHMMGRRCEHWVTDEGIEFDDDNIIFKLIKKGDIYCTSQLQTGSNFMDAPGQQFDALANENKESEEQTEQYFSWPIGEIKKAKFMHKYGYYECRCKMQQKEGWWSAFWLQSPVIGSTLNPKISGVEVDIMEQFWRTKYEPHHIITHNNHWNGYGAQHESTGAFQVKLKETKDGYHTFGLEWEKDYYRYYVDGEMTWELKSPTPISQIEQFILLSTEAVGYRNSQWNQWDDLKEAVGDTFMVDYVRVFERV